MRTLNSIVGPGPDFLDKSKLKREPETAADLIERPAVRVVPLQDGIGARARDGEQQRHEVATDRLDDVVLIIFSGSTFTAF